MNLSKSSTHVRFGTVIDKNLELENGLGSSVSIVHSAENEPASYKLQDRILMRFSGGKQGSFTFF